MRSFALLFSAPEGIADQLPRHVGVDREYIGIGDREHYKQMRTYMVGYDLNKPRANDDYKNLINALQSDFSNWWHHLDSTWIIKTAMTTVQIRDHLQKFIDMGDELLVARLQGDWATKGINSDGNKWLTDNMSLE